MERKRKKRLNFDCFVNSGLQIDNRVRTEGSFPDQRLVIDPMLIVVLLVIINNNNNNNNNNSVIYPRQYL